jgi:hypothetical protein
MFSSKNTIQIIIFLILLIATSIIKNQTRITEKKLFKLNEKITYKEKDINESELDFYFLSSPAEVEKKINILGKNNYIPIQNSKIFFSISDFNNIKKKITILNTRNEKETKKN